MGYPNSHPAQRVTMTVTHQGRQGSQLGKKHGNKWRVHVCPWVNILKGYSAETESFVALLDQLVSNS